MVNSGSFDSDADRNEKGEFTQTNQGAESPQSASSAQAVSGSLCENDFTTQTADSLPISQAIEPTATKTEYKCNILELITGTHEISKPEKIVQRHETKHQKDNNSEATVKLENSVIIQSELFDKRVEEVEISQMPSKESKSPNQNSVCCSVPLEKVQKILNICGTNAQRLIAGSEREKQVPKKDMCLYCDRTFVTPSLKQKHVDRFHSLKHNRRLSARRQATKQSITACMFCEKFNNTECSLRGLFEHLVLEHSKKYFGCLDCDIRFPNVMILENHLIKMHRNLSECMMVKNEPPLLIKDACEGSGNVVADKKASDQSEIGKIAGFSSIYKDDQRPEGFKTRNKRTNVRELMYAESNFAAIANKNGVKGTLPKTKCKLVKSADAVPKQQEENPSTLSTLPTVGPINTHSGDNSRLLGDDDKKEKSKTNCYKELRSKKVSVIGSKTGIKQNVRVTRQQTKNLDNSKPNKKKKNKTDKNEKRHDANVRNIFNPSVVGLYPAFDISFRVKKITDHSIDNIKISSLTFDDVFDKAFFNRVKCNIQENLLNYIDGKLFKSEESENRISSFQKSKEIQTDETNQNLNQKVTCNAVVPVTNVLALSQSGEDLESQTECSTKPIKKKVAINDEVHYKYFTRRKYQAVLSENKDHRDLSKLDMWTQLAVKNRQQKILSDKRTDKEVLEYAESEEYKTKLQVEELDEILDKRGPVEDLREEVIRKVALEKWNGTSGSSKNVDSYFDVTVILNDLLNGLFSTDSVVSAANDKKTISSCYDLTECSHNLETSCGDEIPSMLNLRRISRVSSHTEELNETNGGLGAVKESVVELTGEWARSRIYVCAACGTKVPNMKSLIDHKNLFHENVWCQHYEFVGNQGELYRDLSIPGLGKVGAIEENSDSQMWRKSNARVCSKCNKQFNCLGDLHRHVLECGGDWSWMLARKKYKYRPYGSKPRKKRRGLLKFLHTFRERKNCQSREKRKTIKKFDGPRQKPSDAETIQRMLANLPAKRITRKVICLKDGFQRSLKNKKNFNTKGKKQVKQPKKYLNKSTASNNEKHTNAKGSKRLLRSNSKGSYENTANFRYQKMKRDRTEGDNMNASIRRHSVRNINKILANNMVKTNAILMKRKVINERNNYKENYVTNNQNNSNNPIGQTRNSRKKSTSDKSTNSEYELNNGNDKASASFHKTANGIKYNFQIRTLPQNRKIKKETGVSENNMESYNQRNDTSVVNEHHTNAKYNKQGNYLLQRKELKCSSIFSNNEHKVNTKNSENCKTTMENGKKRLQNKKNSKLYNTTNRNGRKSATVNNHKLIKCNITEESINKMIKKSNFSKRKHTAQNVNNTKTQTTQKHNKKKTVIRKLKSAPKNKLRVNQKNKITKIVQVDGSSQNKSTRSEYDNIESHNSSSFSSNNHFVPNTSSSQTVEYVPKFIFSKEEENTDAFKNPRNMERYNYNKSIVSGSLLCQQLLGLTPLVNNEIQTFADNIKNDNITDTQFKNDCMNTSSFNAVPSDVTPKQENLQNRKEEIKSTNNAATALLKRKVKKQRDLNVCIAMLTSKLQTKRVCDETNQENEIQPASEDPPRTNIAAENNVVESDSLKTNEFVNSESETNASTNQESILTTKTDYFQTLIIGNQEDVLKMNALSDLTVVSSMTNDNENDSIQSETLLMGKNLLENDTNCDTHEDLDKINFRGETERIHPTSNDKFGLYSATNENLADFENAPDITKVNFLANALKTVDNVKHESDKICVVSSNNVIDHLKTNVQQIQTSILKSKKGTHKKKNKICKKSSLKKKLKNHISTMQKLNELMSSEELRKKSLNDHVVTTSSGNHEIHIKNDFLNMSESNKSTLSVSDDFSNSGKENVIIKRKAKLKRRKNSSTNESQKLDHKKTLDNVTFISKTLKIPNNILQNSIKAYDLCDSTDSEDDIPLSQFIKKYNTDGECVKSKTTSEPEINRDCCKITPGPANCEFDENLAKQKKTDDVICTNQDVCLVDVSKSETKDSNRQKSVFLSSEVTSNLTENDRIFGIPYVKMVNVLPSELNKPFVEENGDFPPNDVSTSNIESDVLDLNISSVNENLKISTAHCDVSEENLSPHVTEEEITLLIQESNSREASTLENSVVPENAEKPPIEDSTGENKFNLIKLYDFNDATSSKTKTQPKSGRKSKNVKTKRTAKPKGTNNLENVFCDICNRTYSRSENLLKHKRTLTHIAKLSELEAIEASKAAALANNTKPPAEDTKETTDTFYEKKVDEEEAFSINNITDDKRNGHGAGEENGALPSPESSNAFNLTSSSTKNGLKLVDIINDVLSKPVNDDEYVGHNNFSGFVLSSSAAAAAAAADGGKRCKSLGERKSFDSDKLFISAEPCALDIDLNSGFNISKIPSTANIIVEKQISLLENIIEDSFKSTDKMFVSSNLPLNEEYSSQSNSSNFSLLSTSKQEDCNEITFTHNTNIITNLIKPTLDEDNLIPSTHYEEISEDSSSSHFQFEEHKSRKVLNRDEELFLECCSLLKSSSDMSDLCKRTAKQVNFHKTSEEFDWPKQQSLPEKHAESVFNNNCLSESSSVNAGPLLGHDPYKSSLYSNQGLSERLSITRKIEKDNSFSQPPPVFEDISTESENSSNKSSPTEFTNFNYIPSFGQNEILHSMKFKDRISPTVESAQIPEEYHNANEVTCAESRKCEVRAKAAKDPSVNHHDIQTAKTIELPLQNGFDSIEVTKKTKADMSKQFLTKGAMKTFEGLKVSIPKEGLDMKEVLSCSPTSKRLELEAQEKNLNFIKPTNYKKDVKLLPSTANQIIKVDNNNKKNAAVGIKKDILKQCGNKLGLKVTKKRCPINSKSFKFNADKFSEPKKKPHDIYDFEETQDNIDIFDKDFNSLQTYHSFKNKLSDKINCLSENDDKPISEIDGGVQEIINKQDPGNASKIEEKCGYNSIATMKPPPAKKVSTDNGVTKKKCMIMGRIFKNALKSKLEDEIKTLPTLEDTKKVEDFVLNCNEQISFEHKIVERDHKLTEEEMNVLFDSLLNEGKSDSDKNKSNSSLINNKPNLALDLLSKRSIEHKSKLKGNKNRKRHRANSSSASDEEFSIRKTSKKQCNRRTSGNNKSNECVINLEQELKECIGVASRKSQRKCTSGKQNVLVEYWSSDESNFDADPNTITTQDLLNINNEPIENKLVFDTSQNVENNCADDDDDEDNNQDHDDVIIIDETSNNHLDHELVNDVQCCNNELERKKCLKNRPPLKVHSSEREKKKHNKKDISVCSSVSELNNSQTIASTRQKRTAVDTLYYWSSSSDDEFPEVVEVRPIREEYDEEDRPLQHGWIVGDSPKKLVTMLAQAKGKKIDVECVKKSKKKRTSV